MNQHEHYHPHPHPHPPHPESGGDGDDRAITMGRDDLPNPYRGTLKAGGGAYPPNRVYDVNINTKSNIHPSYYGHHHPPPHSHPPTVVESRHPPTTSSRVQQQQHDEYSRHPPPPPPPTLHQQLQPPASAIGHQQKHGHHNIPPPPPHPADKFGKTITVSNRTTIHDDDGDTADGNNDGLPPVLVTRVFAPSKGGNSAFKPYYRPPPPPLPQVGTISNVPNDDSKAKQVENSTTMTEEGDGDDTSDDRASDDEIKAANLGILQAREEEDDDEDDGMNHATNGIMVESRQDDEMKDPVKMVGGVAGQEGIGCIDHPARDELVELSKTTNSVPIGGGMSQRKKPHPIAMSAVLTTALKRPRDDRDYNQYAFGGVGGGVGSGVDDDTPKHINIRRHPPSFFSHTNSSLSSSFHGQYYHHHGHDQHRHRSQGGYDYNFTQQNGPNVSSMEEEKEDRQDRSTTASTMGGGQRQSYDGDYPREGGDELTQHTSRVQFQDNKVESEVRAAGKGGIQNSWLATTDDRNGNNGLKSASSHEFGGDGSIIGSSSYLNFSRSLSWEIPPGTLSGIGKSTSFGTTQPQQQNHHQQQQQKDEDMGITAIGGANVTEYSEAKAVDFPPLPSSGSGSLPPRKRPILLAPQYHHPDSNTTKVPGGETFGRSYETPATVHHPHDDDRRHRQQQHPPLPLRQQDHSHNHHYPPSNVRSHDHHYRHHHQYPPPPPPPPHHHHPHQPQHPPQQRYHYDSRYEPPRGDFHGIESYGIDHSRGGVSERIGHQPYESAARCNPLPTTEFSANGGSGAPWGKLPYASSNYPHHDGGPRLLHTSARGGNTGDDLDGENYTSDSRSFDSSSLSRKSFRSLDDLEEPMQNLLYRPSFSWERGLDVPSGNVSGNGGDGSDDPPLTSLQIGGGGVAGGTSSPDSMIQLSEQQKIMKALAMRSEIRTIGNPNGPMGVILLLAMPQDRHCLSETLCIVRNNVEVFTATEADINAPAPGRKRPIQVGQVGLRCVYCRMCNQRDRVKRATCFPSSMKRIYRAVIDMKLDHFKNCPYVPSGLKGRLDQLQAGSTRSTGMTVQYFVKSAKELGMMDNEEDGVSIDLKRVGIANFSEQDYNASSPLPPPPLPPPPLPAISMERDTTAPYKADALHSHAHHPNNQNKPKKGKRQQQQQPRQHNNMPPPPQMALPTLSHNAPCSTLPFEARGGMATSFEPQLPEKRYSGKVLLSLPDDENFLSPLRCFLRMNVCAFTASAHDIAVRTPTTFAVRVGQVGVGCVHCLAVPPKARSNRAVCFPFAMSRIYQSVADIQRFHLGECRMMPPNVRAEFLRLQSESAKGSRGLATRTYWIDSAKKIGLADGSAGMYFYRDPSLPPPPYGDASVEKMDSESHDNTCNELVAPEDRPTIADFLYRVMEQLRPCRFTDADRNKRRSKNVGCIGVECKHCAGKIDGRKFFWSSVSAAESNFVSVHSHMLTCKYIPESLKTQLIQLKALRREQTSRLKNGSQKAFFMRVWSRLHGMPVLPPSSSNGSKKPEVSSRSKSSAPKKIHDLNVDAPTNSEFDSDDIRALLESKSTLSSMPSVDESITKLVIQDSAALDIDIGKSDSDLKADQSDASAGNINITASKSSLTSVALNMSTFSMHCKEEADGEGSGCSNTEGMLRS